MPVKSDSKTPTKARGVDGNGKYPTWRGILMVAVACLGIVGAPITWAWSLHISRPHKDAATIGEVREMKEDIGKDIDRLEVRQIRIEDKVDDIRTQVMSVPQRN